MKQPLAAAKLELETMDDPSGSAELEKNSPSAEMAKPSAWYDSWGLGF